MVIHTTVTTCGLGCKVTRSVFLSMFWSWNRWRCRWNYLRQMEFAANVEGYTESWRGGVCLECQGRHFLSEGSVSGGVLWHLPPLQGSDGSALLVMKWVERWWRRIPTSGCVRVLLGVSDEIPWQGPGHEHFPEVPRNYAWFCILPIWPGSAISG